ncbi:hypothetical protein OH687_33435 [Burkholderia anthina]|nr:hypothetical protein OH687_33435 [Burkholderia anthina]
MTRRLEGRADAGIFRQEAVFIDHCRSTSLIISHRNIVAECAILARIDPEDGWYG